MKVALCYSGIYREYDGWEKNHELITKHVDSVYYSTWEGRPYPLINDLVLFPEPIIKYDPFQIIPGGYTREIPVDRRMNLTKQILGHQHIVDHIQGDYDVIIRMRYDTWLGDHDWQYFIQRTFKTPQVHAFGAHIPNKNSTLYKQPPNSIDIGTLVDFMIMHPAHKMQNAFTLDAAAELLPANAGWHQVLVEPYKNPYRNFSGGIQLSRLTDVHKN